MSGLNKASFTNNNNNKINKQCKNERMQLLDELLLQLLDKVDELLVFKGGYMLSKMLSDARMTHDIDLSISDQEEYENMKPKLQNIGEYFVQKGFVDHYEILDIIPKKKSGGIKLKNENGENVIGLDISIQDLSYGITKEDIHIALVDSYCIERMLSDKLYVILSNKRYRRTKDLYDLYIITEFIDINYDLLKDCIYQRGYSDYQFDNIPFSEEDMLKYIHSWESLEIHNPNTNEISDKPDLKLVLKRLYRFVAPFKYDYIKKYWSYNLRRWL